MRAREFLNESLDDVKDVWTSLGIEFSLYERNGTISLSQIVVPKENRKQGIGTKAMRTLVNYADETGQKITLTPSSDFGGSKTRLIQFYRSFGFVPNKGRYKDFTTMDTMIRYPKGSEVIEESRVSVKDQIIQDVRNDGGNTDEYFVRFTGIDKLGYSPNQKFGRSPDVDDPAFDPDYIGRGVGKPALWFYPLKTYLSDKELYAKENPHVWLVRLKPDAWLQPVDRNTDKKIEAPNGKERVGLLKNIKPFPAAIFFKPAFDVVGKYYDYGSQHKRHGEVKGPPKPSFFDRIRGYE